MEKRIGRITHFYTHLCVAVLELEDVLNLGDEIHILGHITDFIQPVDSLEIDHKKVGSAHPGEEVALKVDDYVRQGDAVFNITETS
jgi:hypothetical protein